MAERLFPLLSDKVPFRRIYFKEFIDKFYTPLCTDQTNPREKVRFIFNMLDHDRDGILTSYDLLSSWELVPPASKFGHEISIYIEHYYNHVLKVQGKPNPKETIDFDKFCNLLTAYSSDGSLNSCLMPEIQSKPLEKPGKSKMFSVLVPTRAEIEFYEKQVNKFNPATLE